MLIYEFRVILPLSVDEYQIAQRFTVAEMSMNETGGGEGCEIVKNEPFSGYPLMAGRYSAGQYTLKIYHVSRKIPSLIKLILPKGTLQIYEECWNAYPYTKTVLTNPGYMKDNFQLIIESMHHSGRGEEENLLQLPPDVLKTRLVKIIDIASDPLSNNDYDPAMDPKTFKSTKTGRGPLTDNWIQIASPVMTCYKVVSVNFKWFGAQRTVEKYIQNYQHKLFTVFHRRVVCSTDKWYGLTLADIQRYEEEVREVMDRERTTGQLRGTRSFF